MNFFTPKNNDNKKKHHVVYFPFYLKLLNNILQHLKKYSNDMYIYMHNRI